MARIDDSGWVTAYYANPATGKVEKHRLSTITYHEATHAQAINDGKNRVKKVLSGEEHLWSLEPPIEPVEIEDMTPGGFEAMLKETSPSNPPPAIETSAPDPLRRGPRRRAA